jgi:hypothetical protein
MIRKTGSGSGSRSFFDRDGKKIHKETMEERAACVNRKSKIKRFLRLSRDGKKIRNESGDVCTIFNREIQKEIMSKM